MQTWGSAASLGSLPSHQRQLSVAAPKPISPVSISPLSEHRFPTVDLLPWLSSQSEEGKIFKAKTVISTWYNAQALSPQDTLEI